MNKREYMLIVWGVILVCFIFLYRETQKSIREINDIKNEIENQKSQVEKKEEEPKKITEEDTKIKKSEVLYPIVKNKNMLVYESFFDYLEKIIRLKIEVTENIDLDKIRVLFDENEMSMTLFLIGDDNVIYHLFKYEVIRYSDFYEKYSDSPKPEIIDDTEGYFITRKLLKLEVGEDKYDVLASEIVKYFLENANSLTFEFIYKK